MKDPLAYIEVHGLVMQSARHAMVPSLVEHLAGGRIKGSWWAHPKSRAIYRTLVAVYDSPDVVATTIIDGKITLVHRRLWGPLARLAFDGHIPIPRMGKVTEEHSTAGHHEKRVEPFPDWLPKDVEVPPSTYDAVTALGALTDALLPRPAGGAPRFPPSADPGARGRRR